MKLLREKIILLVCLLFINFSFSQITLSHNIGNVITDTNINGCQYGDVYWARTFVLQDFGINPGKDFVISSGEAAVTYENTNWDSKIQFNIYSIDDNFPASFSENNLIGSSQVADVWTAPSPFYTLNFETPVVVPHNVEKILVEVHQLPSNSSAAVLFCSGTDEDNDISWFKGCNQSFLLGYNNTVDLNFPNANFYITVTGNEAEPLETNEIYNSPTVIYPNPVQDNLNISSADLFVGYEIRNLLGQLVKQDKLESTQTVIPLSSIDKGSYLLYLNGSSGSVITRKILKE